VVFCLLFSQKKNLELSHRKFGLGMLLVQKYFHRSNPNPPYMTITLPGLPALNHMPMGDILMDLACGGYAAGHLSQQAAAEAAGVSRFDFDEALHYRHIPTFTEEMLEQDMAAIGKLGLQ
jgi:hypothetical protein